MENVHGSMSLQTGMMLLATKMPIDMMLMKSLMKDAGKMHVTLHRAVDIAPVPDFPDNKAVFQSHMP